MAMLEAVSNDDGTYIERHRLIKALEALVESQFEALKFTLNPPNGQIPPSLSDQNSRIYALLRWAESPTGPGLEKVRTVLNLILGIEEESPRKGVIEIICPVDDVNKIDTDCLAKIFTFARGMSSDSSVRIRETER